MKKRIISVLIIISLLFTMMPMTAVTAAAAATSATSGGNGGDGNEPEQETEQERERPPHDYKIFDVLNILMYISGIKELTAEQRKLYDFFKNDDIGIMNVLEILKYLLWMESLAGINPNPNPNGGPPDDPRGKQPNPRPPSEPSVGVQIVSESQLRQMGWVESARSPAVVEDLNRTLRSFNITTTGRIRHFISQCAHESGMGRWMREMASGWDYESCAFAAVPRPCTPIQRCVGKILGNNHPGDGPRFKGAGFIQLTGRWNYQQFANHVNDQAVMQGVDYVAHHYPWRSAGFWWHNNSMNALVDGGATVEQVTLRVNGGYNGLSERIRLFGVASGIFN